MKGAKRVKELENLLKVFKAQSKALGKNIQQAERLKKILENASVAR